MFEVHAGSSAVVISIYVAMFMVRYGSKNVKMVDIRYSVANEGEMFDIMNILDGFLADFAQN